jgi:epoxyqueuosine reductase
MQEIKKNKLLLHICCAGCGAFVSQLLSKDFDLTLYFFNPNIESANEYKRRKDEVIRIAALFNLPVIFDNYDHDEWLRTISGKENEPEKGARCYLCYKSRLKKTSEAAKKLGFSHFGTTLSVSPHKVYKYIKEIGENLAQENSVLFFDQDFKKENGFLLSANLSKELGLYRQNYCGCEFSKKNI